GHRALLTSHVRRAFANAHLPHRSPRHLEQTSLIALPSLPFLISLLLPSVCALLNSLAAFFRTRVLYFQWFADSLTKTPGVASPIPIFTSHRSRLTSHVRRAQKRKNASL